ncbi:hypothetical protein KUTeg_003512 [Tegillarca granosa]|uniref:TGF-beta family profile domain-containing protein n=1 Tax=Tegillarca granosa TaxID=220873 RepID=A0ABQ9FNY9_TEGGR|nr:hypothetical protein KUTeg_003512 [Tegillarca granosa]
MVIDGHPITYFLLKKTPKNPQPARQVLESKQLQQQQYIIRATQEPLVNGRSAAGRTTRVHTLIFNITSISTDEEIDLAEIRLYTLVEKDRNTYIGVDRKVSVFEVITFRRRHYRLIDSKHIYGRHSGWESFDVSSAVRRWVRNINSVQILEVRIESVFHSISLGEMDINTTPRGENEPLLVVFSNDYKLEKLRETERHELITHEMDSYDILHSQNSGDNNNITTYSNSDNINNENNNNNNSVRIKRRARRYSCKRQPMYVNFKDIHWDTWIIAPNGYQAYECSGKCFFPLQDNLSPTKHAIIQTLMQSAQPKKVTRACCVPTKLDPISILYIDEQGIITYKYRYEGMVVAECGCR